MRSTVHVRVLTALLAGLLLPLAALATAGAAQAATKPLPVPYDFLLPAVKAGTQIDGNAPGTNDWTCKPSAAHPRAVVLVHGLTGNRSTNWQTYGPLLKNNGYCVFALTYGVAKGSPAPLDQFGGLNSMESSAVELKTFVARVLRATDTSQVDILGHSEGTVMPDYYAKYLGGAKYIHSYVSLAPIWHGTNPAGLDTVSTLGTPFGGTAVLDAVLGKYFASGPELLTHSAFIAKLRAGGTPAVKGIRYTNIVTKYDELVEPYTSGIQAGMTNYTLQDFCTQDFSEHFEIAADPIAAALVLNALDPAHPRAIPCQLVLPFVGGA